MLNILQWNARSLCANGQEFKGYINQMKDKPDVICIQESWLNPTLEFVLKGYISVRRDREEGKGGGCVNFVKEGIPYRVLDKGEAMEYIVVEIWFGNKSYIIINFYNPCKRLTQEGMETITGLRGSRVIWCGDFNAHNTLWGGLLTDANGMVIEEVMERNNLVCINDGTKTRMDVNSGRESAIDLTIVSNALGGIINWEVLNCTVGSDHFPILSSIVNKEVGNIKKGNTGKWKYEKADWEKFERLCEEGLIMIKMNERIIIERIYAELISVIQNAARECIPKSKGKRVGKIVPWWNEECAIAVKRKRKAFKILRKTHNWENMIIYKKAQAETRRTIREMKKKYWRSYCEEIGKNTPIEEVWSMIKKMSGLRREYEYPVLCIGEEIAISDEEKAEMFRKEFSKINSSDNLMRECKEKREKLLKEHPFILEKKRVTNSCLDAPFSYSELKRALKNTKASTPGQDGISYVMLKKLSDESLKIILQFYNKVWEEGILPKRWKEAVIIPIKKPGKDPSIPLNYRPIALTSHLGKVMEKMITDRLMYHMEKNNFFSPYQNGFRHGKSTMDSIVKLESDIRKALINKETLIAVFFDVEKAYDMLWKEGLLIKLDQIGIEGKLYNWIKEFLIERNIKVKIGEYISRKGIIENGTPQGSVISPLLFIIMINDVFATIDKNVNKSLFADDGALWFRGRNVEYIVNKMQAALKNVEEWSYKWGFKFSVEKTKYIFFTNKRSSIDLKINLYNKEIEQVKVIRFLGMWFDTKITWNVHINKMEDKCKKILNVMRCISGREWGADRVALKTIYSTMIRAVLDYGCIAYGTATKSQLGKLERIQSRALRICCGAYPSSPVSALQVEMGEMPIHLRRKQLILTYWINLKGQKDNHPTKGIMETCWEYGKGKVNSFGWIIKDLVQSMKLDEYRVIPAVILPITPLWILPQPYVDLFLLESRKDKEQRMSEAEMAKEYIGIKYEQYIKVFTDASKDPQKGQVGVAYIIPRLKVARGERVSDHVSVFTGELLAIMVAINKISEMGINKTLICSDSSSALMCLEAQKSDTRQDIVLEILQILFMMQQKNKIVQFLWVPAHTGVAGNEAADKLAKHSMAKENIDIQIGYSKLEMKSIIKREINKNWQSYWDNEEKGRHLHLIQPLVGRGRNSFGRRKEDCIISRLRLGHTGLNSTMQIIGKHPTGLCEWCGIRETVEHVLIKCNKYSEERSKMIEEFKLKDNQQLTLKMVLNSAEGSRLIIKFLSRTNLIFRI